VKLWGDGGEKKKEGRPNLISSTRKKRRDGDPKWKKKRVSEEIKEGEKGKGRKKVEGTKLTAS